MRSNLVLLLSLPALGSAALGAACASRARSTTSAPSAACAAQPERERYGLGLGVVLGEQLLGQGKTDAALGAIGDGLSLLRNANTEDRCGCEGRLCLEYKVYGHYLRALARAVLEQKEQALADLAWLDQHGYLKQLAPRTRFWADARFRSLAGEETFQALVKKYRR